MGNGSSDVMLRSVVVEKVLLNHNPAEYGLVVEKLTSHYGLDIYECYWNTEYLVSVIKDVCKNSHQHILNEIKKELEKHGRSFPYENLLVK